MGSEPLHSLDLYPRQWWACQEPERPDDEWCCYDERCRGCILKAAAALANGQSDVLLQNLEVPGSGILLSEIAAGKGLEP